MVLKRRDGIWWMDFRGPEGRGIRKSARSVRPLRRVKGLLTPRYARP